MVRRPARSKNPDQTLSQTSLTLLHRLKDEDSEAWQDLVHLYSPLILYWCQREGVPRSQCEDMLQDVFRTVVANISRFRKEKSTDTFRGWLRTITRSRIVDSHRRAGSEPKAAGGTEAHTRLHQLPDTEIESDVELPQNESQAERELFMRAIEMIRQGFEENTWQAFWRVVVDGRTAQEVAEELQMRPGTVRVAKSRVLKRLREQMGDILD